MIVSSTVGVIAPCAIWDSLSYGIAKLMNVSERGILTTDAVWFTVVLTPFATPRFSAGTRPIIELALGDAKRPLPTPTHAKPTIRAV